MPGILRGAARTSAMTDEIDPHVKESAGWAREAIQEFGGYQTVDRVAAAKSAVAFHEHASGFDFDEKLHAIGQDLDALRPGRGAEWPDLAPAYGVRPAA